MTFCAPRLTLSAPHVFLQDYILEPHLGTHAAYACVFAFMLNMQDRAAGSATCLLLSMQTTALWVASADPWSLSSMSRHASYLPLTALLLHKTLSFCCRLRQLPR